jgi:hypothetical protein
MERLNSGARAAMHVATTPMDPAEASGSYTRNELKK